MSFAFRFDSTIKIPKAIIYFEQTLQFATDNQFKDILIHSFYSLVSIHRVRYLTSQGYCSHLNNDWKNAAKYLQKFLDFPLEETKPNYRPYSGM
jgi:hypothetical protein